MKPNQNGSCRTFSWEWNCDGVWGGAEGGVGGSCRTYFWVKIYAQRMQMRVGRYMGKMYGIVSSFFLCECRKYEIFPLELKVELGFFPNQH